MRKSLFCLAMLMAVGLLFTATALAEEYESYSESPKASRVIAFSENKVPLNVTIPPIEFLSVKAKKKGGVGKFNTLFVKVKAINHGNEDYYAIVKVTLYNASGGVIDQRSNKEGLDEGEGETSLGLRFYKLTKEEVSSIDSYKLEFSVVKDD